MGISATCTANKILNSTQSWTRLFTKFQTVLSRSIHTDEMGKIECLIILSCILVVCFTQVRETQAFAAGLRYGKRTLTAGGSKLQESDPNEQLDQGIGKRAPFEPLSFKQAGICRSYEEN